MDKDYFSVLQNAGIRPSIQRVAIYEYLCKEKNHPTADIIHQALEEKYPTLSRTTCYNTLKLFEEKKVVQSIQIEDEAVRYDADTSAHLHFKCTNCQNVYDIFVKNAAPISNNIKSIISSDFKISKIQTNIWGTCKNCN